MLTLTALRDQLRDLKYPRPLLSATTGIQPGRLRNIIAATVEPHFTEAVAIARALGRDCVTDLIYPVDLHTDTIDPTYYDADLRYWRAGSRVLLSMGLRLSARFGCRPMDLLSCDMTALRQVWAAIATNERGAAPHQCPWCIGEDHHLPTCLPHNLLGTHGTYEDPMLENLATRPSNGRKAGKVAYGLLDLRLEHDFTQRDMAERLGVSINHYARCERSEMSFTLVHADKLCAMLGTTRERIYGTPPATEPVMSHDTPAPHEPELATAS